MWCMSLDGRKEVNDYDASVPETETAAAMRLSVPKFQKFAKSRAG